MLPGSSSAVPAAPDLFWITEADGHAFIAKRRGDEWNNRVETADGFTVEKAGDGFWYYLEVLQGDIPAVSKRRAHMPPRAGMKKHIIPGGKKSRFPFGETQEGSLSAVSFYSGMKQSVFGGTVGTAEAGPLNGSLLFILAEFTDTSGTYPGTGFGSFTTSSINDYFSAASYGAVTLSPASETSGTADDGVIGWVNLGYPHPNPGSTIDNVNRQITKDAILAADPFIDFSAYDNDGDGYVDADELAVVVVVAGYEEAYANPPNPSVWGHRATLGPVVAPVVDTVIVGDYHGGRGGYAQFGEIHLNHQVTLGIMVHELGHLIFGLPDLYDTDGTSSGIGGFGLMSAGSWGKTGSEYSGETPVLPCAWTRYYLWWVDGTESSGSAPVTAAGSPSADRVNSTYKLLTNSQSEYFLVENRQPVGYDAGLARWLGPGFGGLAIWHIDKKKVNNTEECSPPSDCSSTHLMVALKQADGSWHFENNSNDGNSTDLWFSGNAGDFTDVSTPDSNLYDGTLSGAYVTGISSSDTVMTATLASPYITLYSENFESGSLGPEWSVNSTNEGRIVVSADNLPHGGHYHLTMDDTTGNSTYSLNELVLTVDLSGLSGVLLSFYQMEIGDENEAMSASFTGTENSDGVAISADGVTWYRLTDLGIESPAWDYALFEVDLDAAVASAGISYTSDFRIKFQQYDNYPINSDGFAFDDIEIVAPPLLCSDSDGDGFGDPGDASCLSGPQHDCDDTDPAVYPFAAEACDGVDNDCDGPADEDFADLAGPCSVGAGVCEAAGIYVCSGDGLGTECNAIAGDPTENPEVTCNDGLDNDCDGHSDTADSDCAECYIYDLDCDGDVDIVDIMEIASHWNVSCGDPAYDPAYDLDTDCEIDVVDVMQVAAQWGWPN
jgi:M6 family metalloprotease-like protein